MQKGSETKGAGKASSSGGSDTPSERLRLTERPAVTLQERPEEEVKTEEVAVKEDNPLQKRVHRVGQTSVRLMLLGKGPMQILMLTMSHLQAANR